MIDFHVGQKVVCIDGDFSISIGTPYFGLMPVKGSVYTIDALIAHKKGENIAGYRLRKDMLFLRLTEVAIAQVFDSIGFRPVKTTSIEVFRQMLNPVKEDA